MLIRSIDELAGHWPSYADFARESGIKPSHFQTMRSRGAISLEFWPGIVAAAAARSIEGATYEALVFMHVKGKLAVQPIESSS